MKTEDMDIHRFINSADIANHLRDIRYSFSTLEAAWLIWQCKNLTLAERHAAWRELLQSTSDCAVDTDHCVVAWCSLHRLLRGYIDLESKLKTLLTEENQPAVYFYSHRIPDQYAEDNQTVWESDTLCASYSDALSQAANPLYNQGAHPFRIRKKGFDDTLDLTGEFDSRGELIRIAYQQQWFVCGLTGDLLTKHEVDLYDSAESIENGVLGGEIDLEWQDARDLDYADAMVRYQQLLVRALTLFAQEDQKSLHNANKAFETLVRDARRVKHDKMADIQKAQEFVSLMDEIIKVCDTFRK